jgi:hypothetical protein
MTLYLLKVGKAKEVEVIPNIERIFLCSRLAHLNSSKTLNLDKILKVTKTSKKESQNQDQDK